MSFFHLTRENDRWCGVRGTYTTCDGNCDGCPQPQKNEIEEDKCPYYSECGTYRDSYCYYGGWTRCNEYRNK